MTMYKDSCHPFTHRMEVINAWDNFVGKSDKMMEEPLADVLIENAAEWGYDPALLPPDLLSCGSTVWDLIIRILEKYNYL